MPESHDLLRQFYDVELVRRASRPLGGDRERHVVAFAERCVVEGRRSVLEVGCGAGRDGLVLAEAGLAYAGVDLSAVGAGICRDAGLVAVAASALALPFPDASFDAVWSMSTLMHLPGDGMSCALDEIRRVLVPGGVLELGVWGKDRSGDWFDADGRLFRHRTDEELRRLLAAVGDVTDFEAWDYLDEGGAHYQWARVVVPVS